MKKLFTLGLALFGIVLLFAQAKTRRFRIIETTDAHGCYFPYDYINNRPAPGSLAKVYSYVENSRKKFGKERVLLLDAGDLLQGQPPAYYYNFVDTTDEHACAAAMNYMGYDACAIGNHDIETGHAVYDRWTKECRFPVLGANALNLATHAPYWKPYVIVQKDGVRFAVFGMVTPGIPDWLPEPLWSGMRFEDMVETAKKYMPEMRAKADIVIGLFHSGVGSRSTEKRGLENASFETARLVPGFDLILCGHDHRATADSIVNIEGKVVPVINAGPHALKVAVADLTLTKHVDKAGKARFSETAVCKIEDVTHLPPNADFCRRFAPQIAAVKSFSREVIGNNQTAITSRSAFFGSSAFIDFIHSMQLAITKADVSFVAPLSFDAVIPAGKIRVSDMFKLYSYENKLYVMTLTGQQIKDYLEYSYAGWTNQMQSPSDHLLLFNKQHLHSPDAWQRLQTPSFNFDSAAGICYVVDVTRPKGQKVRILCMADGSPFQLSKTYKVAVNSYRGNGGGGLLTKGAGIPKSQLSRHILWASDRDLRHYLMEYIRRKKNIAPHPLGQWHFVPQAWTVPAAKRDSALLFQK